MQDTIPVKYPDTISNEELHKKASVVELDLNGHVIMIETRMIPSVYFSVRIFLMFFVVVLVVVNFSQFQSSLKRALLVKIGLSNTCGYM